MGAEPTAPAAPPAPGWQAVTPETRFEPDRYYAVLAAGEGVFLAVWDEKRKGLVSHPHRDGLWWFVPQKTFRKDDWQGGSLVRYFCELPAIPASALDECNGLWREYFAWLHGEPTEKNPGKGDKGGGSPEKDAEGGDTPAPVPGPNHPRLPKRPSPLQEHEPLPKPEEP